MAQIYRQKGYYKPTDTAANRTPITIASKVDTSVNFDSSYDPKFAEKYLDSKGRLNLLEGGKEFKTFVREFVSQVYQIAVEDMQYAGDKSSRRQDIKTADLNAAKEQTANREAKLQKLKDAKSMAKALDECRNVVPGDPRARYADMCSILPCGSVNVKTGDNKYFNIFDKYQIDSVMYVFKTYEGKLKYVMSSGVLLARAKYWSFQNQQTRRFMFEGELVDIVTIPEFVKKYKSGNMYVFK